MTEPSVVAPVHAPRIERPGLAARLALVAPVAILPALALFGWLAMALQSAIASGGTLPGVLADPALWPAAFGAALPSWLTLTLAGLAMGMMVFIMASGLTLVFGLMDVINFGHGAFISLGAFVGVAVLARFGPWTGSADLALNLAAIGLASLAAMAAAGAAGLVFEQVIVRPVYGAHLKQILVTVGGLIVAEELIRAAWGPAEIFLSRPETLKGALTWQGAALERYRLLAVGVGLVVFAAMLLVLRRTRIGLIVRAGVEDREMVEALGYRLGTVFLAVFVAGSALAGLGGVMWALYQEHVTAQMGGELLVLVFIVVIIGGLGSVEGCFLAALLVGLTQNYVAFLAPKLALFSTIGLMVLVLMWRPRGLMASPGAGGR